VLELKRCNEESNFQSLSHAFIEDYNNCMSRIRNSLPGENIFKYVFHIIHILELRKRMLADYDNRDDNHHNPFGYPHLDLLVRFSSHAIWLDVGTNLSNFQTWTAMNIMFMYLAKQVCDFSFLFTNLSVTS